MKPKGSSLGGKKNNKTDREISKKIISIHLEVSKKRRQ